HLVLNEHCAAVKQIQVDEVDAKRLLQLAAIGGVYLQRLLAFAERGLAADMTVDEFVPGNGAGVVLDDRILVDIEPCEAGLRAAGKVHGRSWRVLCKAKCAQSHL